MSDIEINYSDVHGPDELGKERELRLLRSRVADLEVVVAMRGDKIIPALVELDNKQHNTRTCGFHQQVTVCMDTPRVECSVCEAQLDPIEVLREFTRQERKFTFEVEHLRREKEDLTKVIEALKKERANLKAAVKRAGGNANKVEDAAIFSRFRQPKKIDAP